MNKNSLLKSSAFAVVAALTMTMSVLSSCDNTKEDPAFLTVSDDPVSILPAGGNVTVVVETNTDDWTFSISGGSGWLTGEKIANGVRLTATGNNLSIDIRTAILTIASLKANASKPVVVSQESSLTPYLSIAETTIEISVEGGELTVGVDTNTSDWTFSISGGDGWLTGEKIADGVRLTATENTSTDEREAFLKIASVRADFSEDITITQEALESLPFITVSSTAPVVVNAAGTAATSGTLSYTIETNYPDPWEVSSSKWWLKATKSENGFTLSAAANAFVDPPEEAIVTVSVGTGILAVEINIQVSQLGNSTGTKAASMKTWQITSYDQSVKQLWSDYLEYNGNNKTDMSNTNYNGYDEINGDLCRNKEGLTGNLYNWWYVTIHAAKMCPAPWRVPSKEDFVDLDKAFGDNGGETYHDEVQLQRYMDEWGAVYTGNIRADTQSYVYTPTDAVPMSMCWSISPYEDNDNWAYYMLLTSVGGVNPQHFESSQGKVGGRTVRCVRDVE